MTAHLENVRKLQVEQAMVCVCLWHRPAARARMQANTGLDDNYNMR